jgi:NAD(P)-dependent dehydrogenase (short-subunit alcohol dehydrogenase family)
MSMPRLAELGPQARGFAADAATPAAGEKAAERRRSAMFDRPRTPSTTSPVAAAAPKGDGPLHELTDEGLDYTLDLNLKSVVLSNRAAIRQFLKQGTGGVILNMASVLGYSPSPQYSSPPTPTPPRRPASSASANPSPPITPRRTSA